MSGAQNPPTHFGPAYPVVADVVGLTSAGFSDEAAGAHGPESATHNGYATHTVKTWPPYYREVLEGRKRFEVRYNDRNYRIGDVLDLREYLPGSGFTGHRCLRWITYALDPDGANLPGFGIRPGFVVLSLSTYVDGPHHKAAIAARWRCHCAWPACGAGDTGNAPCSAHKGDLTSGDPS